ncbi:MAG: hypothetical protein DHS20C18_32450 [Saprospiraceae bacterium]|nr:MAG: hypothetical protein DHS20C18_32450 [Saprospiraceae bacterium]
MRCRPRALKLLSRGASGYAKAKHKKQKTFNNFIGKYKFELSEDVSFKQALRAYLEANLWAAKGHFFDDTSLLFLSVPPGMNFKKNLVPSKN